MKNWRLKFCLMLPMIYIIVSGIAFSDTATQSCIVKKEAIVDVQFIFENSVAILDIKKTVENISQNIQKEISLKEVDLKKNEEELVKKKLSLSEKAFQKEVDSFNMRVNEAQKDMQQKKARLMQAHAEAMAEVDRAIKTIIKELANNNEISIVFPSSEILFANENLNLTSQVIDILNSRLKKVEISY